MIEDLQTIMTDITGKDFSQVDTNVSLFSATIGIKARDVLNLFLEIEKRYDILIEADRINDSNFFTIKSIAQEIQKRKNEIYS
ncbi:MAG: hypothetical protein K2N73_01545 [Lachnospiraceae bacterium]|nr:hypothetical protein [Lachnospiraceae bacterium]